MSRTADNVQSIKSMRKRERAHNGSRVEDVTACVTVIVTTTLPFLAFCHSKLTLHIFMSMLILFEPLLQCPLPECTAKQCRPIAYR